MEAIYFHSTLYAFNKEARRDVISKINAAMQDVTVKCTYLAEQHMFRVTAPEQKNGAEVNQLLAETISSYIARELASATEENRAPNVCRFVESEFGESDAISAQSTAVMPPQQASSSHPRQFSGETITLHLISGRLADTTYVKVFRLRDMPAGILERTLTGTDAQASKAVSTGVRLRAVKFDKTGKHHVFNSAVGSPVQSIPTSTSTSISFDAARFATIHDERSNLITTVKKNLDHSDKPWKLGPSSERTTVAQFLAGMGKVEPDLPDVMPDMPEDTKNLILRPDYGPNSTTGRPRTAKARSMSSSSGTGNESSDKSDDDDEVGDRKLRAIFGKNNSGGPKPATVMPSIAIDQTEKLIIAEPDDYASAVRKGAPEPTNLSPRPTPLSQTTNLSQRPSPVSQTSLASKQLQSSSLSSRLPAPSVIELPDYSRMFHKVDGIGLTSVAGQQAEYEHRNQSPRQARVNKSGVGLRQSTSQPPPRFDTPQVQLGKSAKQPRGETMLAALARLTQIRQLIQKVDNSQGLKARELTACFGMILLRHPKEMADDHFKWRTAEEKLKTRQQAQFFPRLTANSADAQYLLHTFTKNKSVNPAVQLQYEIQVKTTGEGHHRTIRMKQTASGISHAVIDEQSIATLYLHEPYRVWDSQVSVRQQLPDHDLSEPAQNFVSSVNTIDQAPSFTAQVPRDVFHVDRVYAKRIFTTTLEHGIVLNVTEVQELQVESVSDPNCNIKAVAAPKQSMIDGQRLWWECKLVTNDVTEQSGDQLQSVVEEMVDKMDGVGFHNKGPWVREEIQKAPGSGSDEWFKVGRW